MRRLYEGIKNLLQPGAKRNTVKTVFWFEITCNKTI
jgi:hypothetical protein